jgi:hypothetical protein
MIEIITDEDTQKLKKSTKVNREDTKAAKIAGMKETMKKFILEPDVDLRYAYNQWIEGMIDAANCRFTKAVVQLFEKTVTEYTTDKSTRLKIIEIATVNSYRDATWAINKLPNRNLRVSPTVSQKICTGTANNIVF